MAEKIADAPHILPGNKRTIALQTAECFDIPNEQYFEVPDAELRTVQLHLNKYGPGIRERTGPTGYYNCHGLAFASRRTFLYDNACIATILQHDAYIYIAEEDVLPGDVILYFDDAGEVQHSGTVVEKAVMIGAFHKVCSKWGANAEFVHNAHSSPYGSNWKFVRVSRKP